MILETRRASNNASEEKSKMPIALKNKLYCNQHNKKIQVRGKFGIKVPTSTREAFLTDIINNNIHWEDATIKEMSALERLGVLKYYPAKKSMKIMMVGNGHQCR